MKSEKTLGDIVCAIILIIFLIFAAFLIFIGIITYNITPQDSEFYQGAEWKCEELNAALFCGRSGMLSNDLSGEITVDEMKFQFSMGYIGRRMDFMIDDDIIFSGKYRVNRKSDIIIKNIDYYDDGEYIDPEMKKIVFKRIKDTSE